MLRPVLPLFEYVVNQDYIAEFLCINKEKTELDCQGKCYLMQRLNEQKEEKNRNLPRIVLEEYPIGFVRLTSVDLIQEAPVFSTLGCLYRSNYNYLFSDDSFHPPNLMV